MKELFENVLTAGFYGSVVILAVMVLRPILKRTPKKVFRLLWLLAFLRLLMPFEIPSPLSLQPDTEAIVQQSWVQREGDVFDPLADFYPEFSGAPVDAPRPVSSGVPAHSDPVENTPAPTVRPISPPKAKTAPAIAFLWLGAGAVILLYSLFTYLRLRFQVREAVRIPGGWECEGIQTAFILGYFRPRVYIPMGMSLSNKSYILAHERTHLRRGDHWLKLLGYIALAVHWYNPLVWAAYVLYCKDIELACDEEVVRSMDLEERKHYSAALLKCSASRAHFAACPVAFGEVSVKTRIKSVLNYRKPGFWISLCGAAAIVFVAVCLMTSPADPKDLPDVDGTEPAAPGIEETGFASNLSESEIADACQKAMEELLGRETFCVRVESQTTADSGAILSPQTLVYRQAGESALTLFYDSETGKMHTGFLAGEEKSAMYMGDAWLEGDYTSYNPRNSLLLYSPEGKTVTFPEGTGVLSADSLSYAAQWNSGDRDFSGTFVYTFHSDGTLASISTEYSYPAGGGTVNHVFDTVTVTEETPADTCKEIQSCGEKILTDEELIVFRANKDRVTDVPSNNRQYDEDYSLGSVQAGWVFLDGGWYFKFGAEDATPTGLTLAVDLSAVYQNDNVSSAHVSPQGNYFLEKLVDNVWTTVTPKSEGALPQEIMDAGDRVTVDWTDTYGTLSPGFYRIGSYYTATSSGGTTDTQVCYAKFRLKDPNTDALLIQCQQALETVLASDSYHVTVTDWLSQHKDQEDAHYYTTEVWRSGGNYLEELLYYRYSDGSLTSNMGNMLRDGVNYNLVWESGSSRNRVADWSVNTFLGEGNFRMWAASFQLYDRYDYDFFQNGNVITAVLPGPSYRDYASTELAFTFDGDGRLTDAVYTIVTETGQRITESELRVLSDSPEEIRQYLDRQDVTTVLAFSWETDQKAYPEDTEGVRTEDFRNTSPVTLSTPLDAIDRAIRDCTLPADGSDDPGTNIFQVSYDEDAKMWKVEFTSSWDRRLYQAVYLTADGITVRTVTLEPQTEY